MADHLAVHPGREFAVSASMYWSNGFGGLAVIVFALAALAGMRRRATTR
jgi:hypothetical protein